MIATDAPPWVENVHNLSIYVLTELRERIIISTIVPLLTYATTHDTAMRPHSDDIQLFDEQGRLSNE